MNDFEMRVARTVREYGMLTEGESVLAGVSGGPDSVALLYCLTRLAPQLRLHITVAHLNHRTRGAESDADEQFVRVIGDRLGVRVVSETLEVPALAASTRRNLEELAREARYGFFRRTADGIGARKIAVGHTLDDQAETVLMRMLRGTGMQGLSGIYPVVDGLVIRPLIEVTRRQVLTYLDGAGLDFREDSSNTNMKHRRNRIRHELMPYLRTRFNPRISQTLALQGRLAREVSDYMETAAGEAFRGLRLPLEEGVFLHRSALLALHPALQNEVVRLALRACLGTLRGITAIHIGEVLSIARGESGHSAALGRGIRAAREFDTVLLRCMPREIPSEFSYIMKWPGSCMVPEAGVKVSAHVQDFEPQHFRERQPVRAALDLDSLPATLVVRSRLPGDCYGGPGHRKVKKLLIDAHLPLRSRASLPMVVAREAVVWIPGFAPAKSFRPRPGSRRCVLLECEPLRAGD